MTLINHTFRAAMGMAIAGVFGGAALAQQSITSFLGISYSQNFNTLSTAAGNQTSVPSGWIISDNGTSAGNYTFNSGSNVQDLHSYANSSAATDRALGLQGDTTARQFGVVFVNNTLRTINSIYVQYTGERWFRPGNDTDRLDFQYSVTTGTDVYGMVSWVNPASNLLDFSVVGTDTTGTSTTIGGTITGLSIPNGGTFAIRWLDTNGSGTTGWGLAIDDLIVMVPEPWQPALFSGLGLVGLVAWKRRQAQGRR